MLFVNTRNRLAETLHQHYVAIDIAEQIMPRDRLGTGKHKIQPLSAELVSLHLRLMPDLKFASRLGSAFFVAKENHFNLRVEQRQTLQRIPLNDSLVAAEGFRRR